MTRSQRRAGKKQQRNKLILGAIIIFIMVGGGFGVYNRGQGLGGRKVEYGEHDFYQQQNQWAAKINGKILKFNYHPVEVEYLNLSREITQTINRGSQLYITSNPNSPYKEYTAAARYQFSQSYSKASDQVIIQGFTANVSSQIPVISCEEAQASAPVIYFKEGNQSQIYINHSCIILEAASSNDYFRLTDRLLYSLLGIIE